MQREHWSVTFVWLVATIVVVGCGTSGSRYRWGPRARGHMGPPTKTTKAQHPPLLVADTGPPKPRKRRGQLRRRGTEAQILVLGFAGKSSATLEGLTRRTLSRMIVGVLRSRTEKMHGVRLRPIAEVPHAANLFAGATKLTTLDRVAMAALRARSGVDGVICGTLDIREGKLALSLDYVSLTHGRVHRSRDFAGDLSARLFKQLEGDVAEFAISLRRVYKATLRVRSTPNGVVVNANGRVMGTTPLTVELPAGRYRLRLSKRGYRPITGTYDLTDGKSLEIAATLYNPMASYYLKQTTARRPDSTMLQTGYRFMLLTRDPLNIDGLHLATLTYLIRFKRWSFGALLGVSPVFGRQTFETVLGPGAGESRQRGASLMTAAHVRYGIINIFSFLTLYGSAEVGMSYNRVGGHSKFGLASALNLGLLTRLTRRRNFSLELNIEAGFAYLGEARYGETQFSLLGQAAVRTRLTPLFGPIFGIGLVFRTWSGVF